VSMINQNAVIFATIYKKIILLLGI
jgi:hypothetical protein